MNPENRSSLPLLRPLCRPSGPGRSGSHALREFSGGVAAVPPCLRPPIRAIYAFARTADDIADEGDAPPAQRLQDLAAFEADLQAVAQGHAPSERWETVFLLLRAMIEQHQLPVNLLADLLSAFAQDVERRVTPRATPTGQNCWTTAAALPTR